LRSTNLYENKINNSDSSYISFHCFCLIGSGVITFIHNWTDSQTHLLYFIIFLKERTGRMGILWTYSRYV